jgi:F-type H+-transporting ATPase subunit a
MGHDVSWASLFPFLEHQPHVINGVIVSVILVEIAILGFRQLKRTEDEIVPEPRMNIRNFVEVIVENVNSLVMDNMGPRGKEFILIIGTLALFILFNNMSGLIPGFLPATDSVNTTFACSITVFVMTHYYGLREHGIKYLKHFMGPIWWLAPLMIPIELISHLARPLSLGMRLFGNITGDHLATSIFFSFVPLVIPVIFMGFGLFVAVIQTLVFSLLSMAYFSGAIMHEEH